MTTIRNDFHAVLEPVPTPMPQSARVGWLSAIVRAVLFGGLALALAFGGLMAVRWAGYVVDNLIIAAALVMAIPGAFLAFAILESLVIYGDSDFVGTILGWFGWGG